MPQPTPTPTPNQPTTNEIIIRPVTPNFHRHHPKTLHYHRFTHTLGQTHEIFVPPGKELEVLALDSAQDHAALMRFPRYSDAPAPGPRRANVLTFRREDDSKGEGEDGKENGDGKGRGEGGEREVSLWLGEDDAGIDRAIGLFVERDYDALEREYEPYSGQVHSSRAVYDEWMRGVERCAREREEEEARGEREKVQEKGKEGGEGV